MKTYKTAEIARNHGIHPNTVRLYEKVGFIPEAERKPNGYRVYTDFHWEQVKLVRIALKVEVLQNGLRKKAIAIIKTAAAGDFDTAICLADSYLRQIETETNNAEEAIRIAESLISGVQPGPDTVFFTRKETADHLQISMDTLRNWEMNGLLTVKRKRNGYRVYTQEDLHKLKMIRSLRCANYSLAAILRMLNALSENSSVNLREVIDTPKENDDIVSVCDRLLTSLNNADKNGQSMLVHLRSMKKQFQFCLPANGREE